jgi:drug/metabolite transporter (DMT)-like permease
MFVIWLVAVLLSTMFFAWVSVLDKKLVTDLFADVRDFYLVFGLMQLVIGPAFMAVAWATGGFGGLEGITWSIATGVAFVGGLMLFFYGLSLEEVSRATPVQSLAPVFATLIAVTLLGESLTLVQGAAVLVVVTGAVLVSLRREGGVLRLARMPAFGVLLMSAVVLGVAFVVTDQATGVASVWAVQGVSTMVLGVLVLVIVARPERLARVPMMLRDRHVAGVMLLTEGALAPAAVFTLMLAFSLGSVSLVSVVAASRPLLVLVISVALSTQAWDVLHEPLDRETLGLKAFATVLIVGGVVALAI